MAASDKRPTGLSRRAALAGADDAERVLFALGGFAARAPELHPLVEALAPQHALTLAELAVPAVKARPQAARDRFLAEYAALVEGDRRVTRREFVLLTFLRQRLGEGAGEPIPARYRKVDELSEDARAVLSLVALAAGGNAGQAFANGERILKLGWSGALPAPALTTAVVSASLERLRHLAPLAKPALLRACVGVPELMALMHAAMSGQIMRDRDSLLSLGTLPAEARVADFLKFWAESLRDRDLRTDQITLRMTRAEIGNTLGMTLETVSRALCRMARSGVIRFNEKGRRDISIPSIEALGGFIHEAVVPSPRQTS
mgnify:CR=1 FL=1